VELSDEPAVTTLDHGDADPQLCQIFPPLFSDIYFQINWLSHFRRYGVVM
jgi:hypothetical protein